MGEFLQKLRTEMTIKKMRESVRSKIQQNVCSPADLCIYKPEKWYDEEFSLKGESQIEHSFYMGNRHSKYLFRFDDGKITEMHAIY